MTAAQQVLIAGPSWVGDMVMAHSLVQVLRQRDPQARIDMLAPAWTHALLKHMPGTDRAIEMPLGHGRLALEQRYRLGKALASYGYDRAIVLPNSFGSAWDLRRAGMPGSLGYRPI